MRKPRKRKSVQNKKSKNLLPKPKLTIIRSNPIQSKTSIKKKTTSTTTTTTTKTIDLINSTIETKTETKTNFHEHKEENVPNEKKQILFTKTQIQTETEVKIDDILHDDECIAAEESVKREIISPSKRADTPHNYLLFFPKTHEEHESKVAPEVNSKHNTPKFVNSVNTEQKTTKDINTNDDSNHKTSDNHNESKNKSVMTTVNENEIFEAAVVDVSVVNVSVDNHKNSRNSSEELDWDISGADTSSDDDSEDTEGSKKKKVTFAVKC